MNKWKVFSFLAFLLLLGTTKTFACSCAGRGLPCEDYWKASVVFIGTVASSTTATYKLNEREFDGRLIHFAVDRAFRGVEGAEIEVTNSQFPQSGGVASVMVQPVDVSPQPTTPYTKHPCLSSATTLISLPAHDTSEMLNVWPGFTIVPSGTRSGPQAS